MTEMDSGAAKVIKRLGTTKAKQLYAQIIAADRISVKNASPSSRGKNIYAARRAPLLRRYHVTAAEADRLCMHGLMKKWSRPVR